MSDSSVDQGILQNILVNLVTEPDSVQIDRKIDEQGVLLSVQVNEKDMGIVIGRSGSMASAIKTLMRAVGKAHKMNIRVQFLEPDGSVKYYANPPKNHDDRGDKLAAPKPSEDKAEDKGKSGDTPNLDDDLKEFVIN
jgi:predicted RNA-binding protein YlqC (UPF0109 family)